jgi:hypothetical protein
VQRGGRKADHAGEEVGEEPLGVAQKRALALRAPQLLNKREGDDLRVREPLERLVAVAPGVEDAVGLVHEAEQHDHGLFCLGEAWGMVGLGHLSLLGEGRLRWPPFYLVSDPRNSHLEAYSGCRPPSSWLELNKSEVHIHDLA